MGGFLQTSPAAKEPNSRAIITVAAVGLIFAFALALALVFHTTPKQAAPPPPYASQLELKNLKMSTAQNFVGATVTYVDGTIANHGDQTVTHAVAHVTFKDSTDQVAQADDMPLQVLKSSSPYDDAVDLSVLPLAPGTEKQFRLTFEHVSATWNQAYPDVRIKALTLANQTKGK